MPWAKTMSAVDERAVRRYGALLYGPGHIDDIVQSLQTTPAGVWVARDVLRAACLPELPITDPAVATEAAKARSGAAISPVLIVRGRPAIILDGYHRTCAAACQGLRVRAIVVSD